MSDQKIERRSGIGWNEFINEYVKTNTPVILTDAAAGWQAHKLFNPDYFKKNYPEKTASISDKRYTLSEYIDLMLASTEANPAPYPFKIDIEKNFTELLPFIQPGFSVLENNWLKSPLITKRVMPQAATLEIFFGGESGWFPYIHYDLYGLYAIVTQVYGRKEFTVYAPGQEVYLYPEKEHPWKSSIKEYYKPDYNKYPLFKEASPVSDVVSPGETIFVPKGWWHTARSLEPTISIAQDLLTRYNWDIFERDVLFYKKKEGALKAAAYALYMKFVGLSLHMKNG
ncbi:MAG TPA: cupin-like domain-containing protein [Bacteroidia bacterium]|nr:cupin-like domain-containing protein [Bacteroidia bacterium]